MVESISAGQATNPSTEHWAGKDQSSTFFAQLLSSLCYVLLCNNVSVPSNSIDLLSSTNPSQQAEQPIPVRDAGQEEIKAQLAQSRERRRRGWPFPQVDSKTFL